MIQGERSSAWLPTRSWFTKRAGGQYGEFRSVAEYVEMISGVGRVPVERSTDYRQRRRIDPGDPPFGPQLGPEADGTPLVESGEVPETAGDPSTAD